MLRCNPHSYPSEYQGVSLGSQFVLLWVELPKASLTFYV